MVLAMGGACAPPSQAATQNKMLTLSQAIGAEANGKLHDFYKQRSFRPLWLTNGQLGPSADRLITHMAASSLDGLDSGDYDLADLRQLITQARRGDVRARAHAEIKLSEAFVRFVTDMRDAEKIGMTYLDKSVRPKKPGTVLVLRAAALAPSFDAYVNAMGWMNPNYVRIRSLIARANRAKTSADTRRRLALNLERARILPSAWTHHIVVDSASGRLWYYQAGAQKGTMKVVVGKAESPTPMYAGVVQYAVLKPYWNVPVDLTRMLIAPKVLAGKSLAGQGFEALSDWSNAPRILTPSEIDWVKVARGDQEIRVRQLPGPRNSMGRVKFMFPNETGIFLHDTPERGLFAKFNRHFSNGCVRLENAAALGQWLLGRPLPTRTAYPDQMVTLSAPVPIFMTYFTAIETKSGVGFLRDVYGRDKPRN